MSTVRRFQPAEKVWLREVAAHCRELADGDIQPECKSYGLCWELQYRFGLTSRQLDMLWRDWEEHSGMPNYPVPEYPGQSERGAMWSYDRAENKWADDAYGDARRRLCEFLAETLEEYAK